jgi:hypothetical protein
VAGQKAAETLEGAENPRDFSCWGRRKSRKMVAAGFSGHQDFLIGDLRRMGPLGDEGQLQREDGLKKRAIVTGMPTSP